MVWDPETKDGKPQRPSFAAVPPRRNGMGTAAWIIGGLSFIPLIGVLFGAGSIVWGLTAWKRGGGWLALAGVGGIVLTVAIYSGLGLLTRDISRGGEFSRGIRERFAQPALIGLVNAIESYRKTHGVYPPSLDELQQDAPKDAVVLIVDPSFGYGSEKREFHYERVGDDHYYLLGVGRDGVPFTDDDILPNMPTDASAKSGLLLQRSHHGSRAVDAPKWIEAAAGRGLLRPGYSQERIVA